jgi:type I restriction enzyme S subunit
MDNAYRRSRLRTGDLLFSIRGTVGRTALVPDLLELANITQDTARIGIAKGDTHFVRYFLETDKVQRFLKVHTLGVAVQGINLRDVRRIPLMLPPFPSNAKSPGF